MGWIFRPPHQFAQQRKLRGKFPLSNGRAKIETLTDNFDDSSLDAAKWTSYANAGATTAETTQKIVVTVDNSAASVYGGIVAVQKFSLFESSVSFKVDTYPAQSVNTQIYLLLAHPAGGTMNINNRIVLQSINGQWQARYRDNSGSDSPAGSFTGTPTHLKISWSAGILHYWYSNGGASWTEIGTGVALDRPWMGSLYIELAFGHFATDIASNTAKLDDFNVISAVNYTQTNTGTITPAGALIKKALKTWTGAITPAGALPKKALNTWAGTITPAGVLATLRVSLRTFTGTITPAGALPKTALKRLTGTVTPAGVLTALRVLMRTFTGSVTPAGALPKRVNKYFGAGGWGSGWTGPWGEGDGIVPAGALALVKTTGTVTSRTFTGQVIPAGTLSLSVRKTLTGSVTPAGALVKRANKTLAGTITPAGALPRRTLKTYTGTITPASVLTNLAILQPRFPLFQGTITPAGVLHLKVFKPLSGQITPRGRLCKQWPFPTWVSVTDGSLVLTGVNDAALTFSAVSDTSLSLSAVSDTSLTLAGVTDTTLTPTVIPEECS